ncbi:MAG: hypothetical protein PHZ11_09520, partial [Desulfitobacteriaceae bacterium]|nr:hypothetical protein [Desulfitobacteriaceae bacterium]
MKQYEIIITSAAENDLQEIFKYIATELLEPLGVNSLAISMGYGVRVGRKKYFRVRNIALN